MPHQSFTLLRNAALSSVALLWITVPCAASPFTSLQVFGDGVCTTTDNVSTSAPFHGNRYCNGRVWIEVLCQWQGLPYDVSTKGAGQKSSSRCGAGFFCQTMYSMLYIV